MLCCMRRKRREKHDIQTEAQSSEKQIPDCTAVCITSSDPLEKHVASESGVSCKSDFSKEAVIYFKEGSSLGSEQQRPDCAAISDSDLSDEELQGKPKRPEHPRIMERHRKRVASESGVSCKSDFSKEAVIYFKEGSSLGEELQGKPKRPEHPRIMERHRKRVASESGVSCKSDFSKEAVIYFKEGSSLGSEQQESDSAAIWITDDSDLSEICVASDSEVVISFKEAFPLRKIVAFDSGVSSKSDDSQDAVINV